MGRISLSQIIAGFFLTIGLLFCALILFNVPSFYLEQGLPLFPAFMLAQTMALVAAILAYLMYQYVIADLWPSRNARNIAATDKEPWLSRPDWARGVITHSDMGATIFLWYFAVNWWGAIAFVISDKGKDLLTADITIQVLVAAFVLIGLLTIYAAIRRTYRWRRFGCSELEMTRVPARPGTPFEGAIRLDIQPVPKQPLEISLSGRNREHVVFERNGAMERRTRDHRDHPPFFETSQKVKLPPVKTGSERRELPFSFILPAHAPASGMHGDAQETIWEVAVRTTGKKDPVFAASFEIPVFPEA